jgi:PQQ-like domain
MHPRRFVVLTILLIATAALVVVVFWGYAIDGRDTRSPGIGQVVDGPEIAACDKALLEGSTSSFAQAVSQSQALASLLVPLEQIYGMDAIASPLISEGQVYFVKDHSYSGNGGPPYYYELYRATSSDVADGTANPTLLAQIPSLEGETFFKLGVTSGVLVYAVSGYSEKTSPISYGIYAIDAQTGRWLWGMTSTEIMTPALAADGIYLYGDGELTRVTSSTGHAMWQFKKSAGIPFFVGNRVYLSGGATTSSIQPTSQTDIYSLDAATGEVITDIPIKFEMVQSWSQCGGDIYFESGGLTFAMVGRFDPRTGEVQYIGN